MCTENFKGITDDHSCIQLSDVDPKLQCIRRYQPGQFSLRHLPLMCSYIFVSMTYGIMMENAGFGWYYSLFVSLAFPKGIAAVRSVENAVR